MSYSDWQADTIRRALNRYRYNAGRNGTALSLTRVHELILLSDRSRSDALKYEVLRRFATSDHLPEARNLNSIRDFLLAEKYLSEEELDPKTADLEEMLAVQAYLANFDREAKSVVATVKPNYMADLEDELYKDKVMLRTLIGRSGCFFKAEEVFERSSSTIDNNTVWDQKESFVNVRVRRRGYGFVSTRHNLVYIYLRGADPVDRVTYVQAWQNYPPSTLGQFFAVRSGRELVGGQSYKYRDSVGPVELNNVYRFVPQDNVEQTEKLLS